MDFQVVIRKEFPSSASSLVTEFWDSHTVCNPVLHTDFLQPKQRIQKEEEEKILCLLVKKYTTYRKDLRHHIGLVFFRPHSQSPPLSVFSEKYCGTLKLLQEDKCSPWATLKLKAIYWNALEVKEPMGHVLRKTGELKKAELDGEV